MLVSHHIYPPLNFMAEDDLIAFLLFYGNVLQDIHTLWCLGSLE